AYDGNALVINGRTGWTGLPTTSASFQSGFAGTYDIFLAKFCDPIDAFSITNSTPLSFCPRDSVVLRVESGFQNYQWNTGASGVELIVKASGRYWCRATYNDCDAFSDTVVVTVYSVDTPKVSITGSRSFCDGDSAVLTISSGYRSQHWSNNRNENRI